MTQDHQETLPSCVSDLSVACRMLWSCPRGDGEKIIYPDDPPPGQVPDNCPKAKD